MTGCATQSSSAATPARTSNYIVNGTALTVTSANNLGDNDWSLTTIGGRAADGGGTGGCCGPWGGDIAEIILFDRALDEAEQNAIGAYLSGKYAITTTYSSPEGTIDSISLAPLAALPAYRRRGLRDL